MPRIVQVDADLRIADDVEVVLGEVGGDDAGNERLDLGDRLVLDGRIDRDGPGGHAGAAANHHDRLRVRRHQRREVPEHALQPHVLRLARGLNLAGVVIVADAVRPLRDGDRGVPSLADVDDVRLTKLRRGIAAIRDQDARHRMHADRQEAGNSGGNGHGDHRHLRFR
jgi:hypothetical protein